MGTAVAVLLLAGVAFALARPVWRPALEPLDDAIGPASRLRALEERKTAIYGSIRDLGFDLRTDKVTREDYEIEVAKLKAEAAAVLADIERLRGEPPRGPERIESLIAAARERLPTPSADAVVTAGDGADAPAIFCTQCGRKINEGDRFCGGCGRPLEGSE